MFKLLIICIYIHNFFTVLVYTIVAYIINKYNVFKLNLFLKAVMVNFLILLKLCDIFNLQLLVELCLLYIKKAPIL